MEQQRSRGVNIEQVKLEIKQRPPLQHLASQTLLMLTLALAFFFISTMLLINDFKHKT
jgi:hypothetical protein